MKRKTTIAYAIALAIVGLLITSAAGLSTTIGLPATKDIEKNQVDEVADFFVAAGAPEGNYVLSDKYSIKTSSDFSSEMKKSLSSTVQESRAEKQVISLPSQSVEKKILPSKNMGAREEYTLLVKNPALGTQDNGSLMLGYRQYFSNDTITEDIVVWEGNNNWGDNVSWGDSYYYDSVIDYPSIHFRGVNASGPLYSGTVVDDSASGTLGGATYIHEVVGDVMNADSSIMMFWNWSSYGWYGATMAENAEAFYPSEEWAWGFNSHVMSTTYVSGPDPDLTYQNNGGFINYQTTAAGGGTISWYESIGGCLSTDAAIDENSAWVVPGYGTVEIAAYAAWDPENGTGTGLHYPAIRSFDWEETCPLDNENAHDQLYYWTYDDPTLSLERPAIDAGNNNMVCLWEMHNGNVSDPTEVGVVIWANNTGNISDLDPTAYIGVTTIPDGVNKVENPEICHVTGDTFIGHVTIDNELLYFVTYDGGQTWDGLYTQSPEGQVVVNRYRNCDISDNGLMSIWEYTFDDGPGAGSGNRLMYTFNTVRVEGDLTYEEGDPANGCDVEITNLNKSRSWNQNTGAGNHYEQILLLGLDIYSDPPADFRFYATDGYYYNETLHTFDGALDHIMTFDLVLNSEPIQIVGARSYADHGPAGILYIDLMAGPNLAVENRFNPLNSFQFDLSGPVSSVTCDEGTVTLIDSDTIQVDLTSPMVHKNWHTITLHGDVEDTFTVGYLQGDTNHDGIVSTADFSVVKPKFGQTPASPAVPGFCPPQFDTGNDGIVSTADASIIKPKFGHGLP